MQERETRLAAMDAALKRALIDAGKGRVKPANEVFDRLEKKYRRMAGEPGKRPHRRRRRSGS
jgi:antitoxin ParD1/3/4